MRKKKNKNGFTLVELLVATVVTSIVLTAVAALAFALSSADSAFGETSQKQAQIRYTTFRIQELIRNSVLVCSVTDEDIALWLSDNNNDGLINISEIAYIEIGEEHDHLHLCTFLSSNSSEIELSSIKEFSSNWWTPYCHDVEYVRLLPECSNVYIQFDRLPPQSRFINISFDLTENDIVRKYQVNSTLRSNYINLLDEDNNITVDDD